MNEIAKSHMTLEQIKALDSLDKQATPNELKTTNQVVKNYADGAPNPTGRGGFGDNPENRSPGGWKKEMVFSYQYKRFMNMSAAEFEAFAKTPKDKMTMVELGAYMRVKAMLKSLPDAKEITDRTEGRAPQGIDLTTNGKDIVIPILGGASALSGDDSDQETT